MNAYPYVRAALIGSSASPVSNRGSFNRGSRRNACTRQYRKCPSQPDRILEYLNTHNGGLVNQVRPSVDNEVAPIVSAIVNEAIENNRLFALDDEDSAGGGHSTTTGSGDDPFGLHSLMSTGDAVLTQALVNGLSGYLAGGLTSLAQNVANG